MTYYLDPAALKATRRPTATPLARRVLRDALVGAAVHSARLAARVERGAAPAAARSATLAPYARRRGLDVRLVEAAVLLAVAVYFAAGLVAVLLA
jgi:hypothetical protein